MASDQVTITRDQRLLLQAAVGEPTLALRYFAQWWKDADIEHAGTTEYRLLPLVYHNIGPLIPDKIVAARVRGVAKHVWLLNHHYAALGALALDRLRAAGVPTLILKGAAMMAAVSDDNMRSIHDCDILVPVERAPEALAAMAELGLENPYMAFRHFTDYDFKMTHGLKLLRPGERSFHLDIHWRPLRNVGAKQLTDEFFDRSVPCALWGRETRRPCFEHMLLHGIVHGTEWSPVPRYDWLADAALILRRAGPDFSWEYLADAAGRYRLGSIVRAGLNKMARTLDIPIPATALNRLPRDRAIDRAETRWHTMDPARMSPVGRSVMALQSFQRRELGLAAWRILPEACRSLLGPPPSSQTAPAMAADAEDRIIYLSGWSWPEAKGRWTDGPLASFAVRRAPGRKGENLRLAGAMFHRPGKPQIVEVYHRWRRLARLSWRRRYCVSVIRLPPALREREVFTLQLRICSPAAPADIAHGADTRRLGLFLEHVCVFSRRR